MNMTRQAKQRAYYLANREKIIARSAANQKANAARVKAKNDAYRAAHPEKQREWHENWKRKHPGRKAALGSAWKAANPEKVNANTAHRRAIKHSASVAWADRKKIREAYRAAKLKTAATGIKWEVDHIVPLRSPLVCGLHCEANLQVIPSRANRLKGNSHHA